MGTRFSLRPETLELPSRAESLSLRVALLLSVSSLAPPFVVDGRGLVVPGRGLFGFEVNGLRGVISVCTRPLADLTLRLLGGESVTAGEAPCCCCIYGLFQKDVDDYKQYKILNNIIKQRFGT